MSEKQHLRQKKQLLFLPIAVRKPISVETQYKMMNLKIRHNTLTLTQAPTHIGSCILGLLFRSVVLAVIIRMEENH